MIFKPLQRRIVRGTLKSDMIVKELKKLVQKALKEDIEVVFEHPENPEHGDYSTNVALILGQQSGQNPKDIAEKLQESIKKTEIISKIEVAGPGFLNFFLSKEYFVGELKEIVRQKEKYGSGKEKKTIVIDYSSPNIAKAFGIGHLRSTIIGRAIYNLYGFLGWKTVGINHLGDWGTQFGKLLYQIEKEGLKENDFTNEKLEELYVQFHKDELEGGNRQQLEEEARVWFKKLEDGDKKARKLWKTVKNISIKEFNRIYELLGIKFDYVLGESFYEPMLKEIVEEAKKKGLVKKSRGALIVEFPEEKLPPAILLKSDEATNYFTRDLATVKYRLKKWKPDTIIYEVGAEQTLHLKQVFWAVELLGWAKREKFKHVAHGLYRTQQGKFSTRKGQTIHLEEVLEDAIARAKEIIEKSETARGLSVKEKDNVAKTVGIGSVKYNDLMQHPSSDIVFDWDKILNLKGNSAPYLQYTYARCKSILLQSSLARVSYSHLTESKISTEEEKVLRLLYRFPEVVRDAAENFSPNLVASFVFDVAQAYNNFYNTHRVLQAETEEVKQFRLVLTKACAQIIQNSLSLLGIKTVERM
ncbi:MAG: arginine--tRNA ligase [bacterium]|nr:arginine--tRNA ligase [bacterium]